MTPRLQDNRIASVDALPEGPAFHTQGSLRTDSAINRLGYECNADTTVMYLLWITAKSHIESQSTRMNPQVGARQSR